MPMPTDPLETRAILRAVIDVLAEPLEGEAKEQFVRGAIKAMNKTAPAPGKTQKRQSFTVISSE